MPSASDTPVNDGNLGQKGHDGVRKVQYLCLTICGYRKPDMTEEDYRHHMTQVSAPLTKDLMVKYGVKRWTQVCLSRVPDGDRVDSDCPDSQKDS